METVVDKLLEVDRKARRMIDDAQQYYEGTLKEIEVEKKRILQSYTDRAKAHLDDVKANEEAAKAEQLAEIQNQFGALSQKLTDRYNDKHEWWEDELVKRVLAGADEPSATE